MKIQRKVTTHHAMRPVPHINHVWSTSVSFEDSGWWTPGAEAIDSEFPLSPLVGNSAGSTNRNPEKELEDG